MPEDFEELFNEDKAKQPKGTCIKIHLLFDYLLILLSGTQLN